MLFRVGAGGGIVCDCGGRCFRGGRLGVVGNPIGIDVEHVEKAGIG